MPAYDWLRPALFALPPEAAHALALMALRVYGRGHVRAPPSPPVRAMGMALPNRIGLAAGFDKNAVALIGALRLGFGFVEAGTVTLRPQRGNPKPRLFRLGKDAALVNRMGFNNAGAVAVAANALRQRRRLQGAASGAIGISIGKNRDTPLADAADEYRACLAAVYPAADYIAVNLSSPNTPGLRGLQTPAEAAALIAALAEERDELTRTRRTSGRPLLLKLGPDLAPEQLAAVAEAALAAGADGFVLVNTTVARPPGLRSRHAKEAGGLSGPPLLPATLAAVRGMRTAIGPKPPIIAVGGVSSAADARALREAGADLIQIYTALAYQGPGLIRELAAAT